MSIEEQVMTKTDAEEIVEAYETYEDGACSCHISPPCDKCMNQPLKEEYLEAQKFLAALEDEANVD